MEISRWHLGVISFSNYLAIQMIYHCGVVFCLYNVTTLYNITLGFKIFALLTCISITNKFCLRLQGNLLTYFSRELLNLSLRYKYLQWGNRWVELKCWWIEFWWPYDGMYMIFYLCCFPSAAVLCLAYGLCHNSIWLMWVISTGLELVEQFMVFLV